MPTLRPKYIPCRYTDPLIHNSVPAGIRLLCSFRTIGQATIQQTPQCLRVRAYRVESLNDCKAGRSIVLYDSFPE